MTERADSESELLRAEGEAGAPAERVMASRAPAIEDKLFLDRFRVAEEPHIRIIDGEVCSDKCADQPCLYFCPAYVYRLEKDRITVAWEGCVECGSCRIGCPHLNIEWRFPTGGYGVSHRFG